MALYEHIFLARQDVSAAQVEELTKTYTDLLGTNGGTVAKTEYWGLKSLSYRINKNRKAHYVLMNVDAPATAVSEMERQMRIHDDVIRYMTIRVEAHEDGPSAMMKKSDRDDRGPRGGRGGFDRGPRGGGFDRGPRGDGGDRGPRGDGGDRGPRGDGGDRGPRGDVGDRGPRGDGGDRGERSERKEGGE
jgi:small subunit ribosomal protein S6